MVELTAMSFGRKAPKHLAFTTTEHNHIKTFCRGRSVNMVVTYGPFGDYERPNDGPWDWGKDAIITCKQCLKMITKKWPEALAKGEK